MVAAATQMAREGGRDVAGVAESEIGARFLFLFPPNSCHRIPVSILLIFTSPLHGSHRPDHRPALPSPARRGNTKSCALCAAKAYSRVVVRREVVEEHARPVATRAIRKFVGDEAADLSAAPALGEPTGGEVHGRVVVRLEVRAERLGCLEVSGADGAREGLARWVGVGAAGGLRPPRLLRHVPLHALSSDVLVGRFLVAIVATVRRRGLASVAALSVFVMTPPNEHTSEGGRDGRGVPYHAESTLSRSQVLKRDKHRKKKKRNSSPSQAPRRCTLSDEDRQQACDQ